MTSRIGFGSCNSQFYEQLMWDNVLDRNLSAFVWGGDAIYADRKAPFSRDPEAGRATPAILRKYYEEQKTVPGYARLLESNIPILGAIDDHDFGVNNGDRTYRYRSESGVAFACEFLGLEGTAMCDRARDGLGIYGVKVMDFWRSKGNEMLSDEEAGLDPDVVQDFAEAGIPPLSDRSVAIFLLDVRSNKTPYIKKGFDSYDYYGDFLGEKQWKWFEEAIKRSTAAVNIFVQGLQVHPDRVGPAEMEFWSNFPRSRHRLYQAILQDNVRAPILISGDVHHAQLLRKDCRRTVEETGSTQVLKPTKPLLEVTTSGMTHSWAAEENFCSRPDMFLCDMPHFKFATRTGMQLGHWLNSERSWTDLIDLSKPGMEQHRTGEGKQGMQFSLKLNFGELEFDWERRSVTARILGREVGAPPVLSTNWSLDFLSGAGIDDNAQLHDHYFIETYEHLKEYGVVGDDAMNDGEWICTAYRGPPSSIHAVMGFVLPVSYLLSLSFFPFLLPFIILIVFLFRRRAYNTKKLLKQKSC